MRTALLAIGVGISTAITLQREKELSAQIVMVTLVTEVLTIVISGLIEIA